MRDPSAPDSTEITSISKPPGLTIEDHTHALSEAVRQLRQSLDRAAIAAQTNSPTGFDQAMDQNATNYDVVQILRTGTPEQILQVLQQHPHLLPPDSPLRPQTDEQATATTSAPTPDLSPTPTSQTPHTSPSPIETVASDSLDQTLSELTHRLRLLKSKAAGTAINPAEILKDALSTGSQVANNQPTATASDTTDSHQTQASPSSQSDDRPPSEVSSDQPPEYHETVSTEQAQQAISDAFAAPKAAVDKVTGRVQGEISGRIQSVQDSVVEKILGTSGSSEAVEITATQTAVTTGKVVVASTIGINTGTTVQKNYKDYTINHNKLTGVNTRTARIRAEHITLQGGTEQEALAANLPSFIGVDKSHKKMGAKASRRNRKQKRKPKGKAARRARETQVAQREAAKRATKAGVKAAEKKVIKGAAKQVAKTGAKAAASKAVGALGGTAIGGPVGFLAGLLLTMGLSALANKKFWKGVRNLLAVLAVKAGIAISKIIGTIGQLTSTVAGGVIGFASGGPLGALLGSVLGNRIHEWITSRGGYTQTVGEGLHSAVGSSSTSTTGVAAEVGEGLSSSLSAESLGVASGKGLASPIPQNLIYNPSTGTISQASGLNLSGLMDAGSATPTQTILWLVASPLLIAAVGTLFVATVILVSFTVPNPQPIETQYITGPITPGGGGGGGPIVPQPVEPASGDLMTDIEQAASAACVPTGLVAAVMQTESGAYGWSDSEYQRFSTPGWWLDADDGSGNSINCYQSHYGPENSPQDNECRAGYCYDTCTTTGACGKKYACNANNQCNQVIPSLPCATDGQCSEHDVMGATQFERKTFYSNPTNPGQSQNCWARDGSGNNCYSTAGNRCNAFDIVRATANKLAADGGANCTQPVWDLGQICVAARKYCGSCGQVETFDEATLSDSATYPCKNWYLKPGDNAYGDPLGACTATHPDTGALEGYCDKIVRIYTGS